MTVWTPELENSFRNLVCFLLFPVHLEEEFLPLPCFTVNWFLLTLLYFLLHFMVFLWNLSVGILWELSENWISWKGFVFPSKKFWIILTWDHLNFWLEIVQNIETVGIWVEGVCVKASRDDEILSPSALC